MVAEDKKKQKKVRDGPQVASCIAVRYVSHLRVGCREASWLAAPQ
jgi:hypothetical protein